MQLGLALLRFVVGGLFMGHGLQKLAGWFGGGGLKATGEAFESMDLRPGVAHAAAAGAAETGGGALIAAGLATPLGASLLSGTMITAIRKVHAANGPWASKGGYEYNVVLMAVVFALADVGPGRLSLDQARGRRRAGLGWALGQLAAGALGSAAAIAIGSRGSQATAEPGPEAGAEESTNGNAPSAAHTATI
jgi:putative oxidoreductase